MSTITVTWRASEELRKAELVQTGKMGTELRQVVFELEALSPDQRAGLVELVDIGASGLRLDVSSGIEITKDKRSCSRVAQFDVHCSDKPLPLDTEPGPEVVIHMGKEIASDLVLAKAQYADEQKAEQANKAAEDTARKAKQQEIEEYVSRMQAQVEALAEAKDLEGLEAFVRPQPCPELAWADSERIGVLEAIKEIRSEQAKLEKASWIEAHGSGHLQRAFGKDYDCQRLYVRERAAVEAPGFTVDYDNAAEWKSRACPSAEALDIEDAVSCIAEALSLGKPETVWLTSPAQDVRTGDANEDECFEACEAVVLRKYLGKYDLVKMV